MTLEQILSAGMFWDFGQVPEDVHRQIRALVRAGEWVKSRQNWYGTDLQRDVYYRKDFSN